MIYMYDVILLSHKKEWNLAICDYMGGLKGIFLSEIREKQIPYGFTYMWNLKNKIS